MLRQSLIFAFALSMMFAVASSSTFCFNHCMACLMIGDRYCMKTPSHVTGGPMCLTSCGIKEHEVPGGNIYNTIYKIQGCRSNGGDVDSCLQNHGITLGFMGPAAIVY